MQSRTNAIYDCIYEAVCAVDENGHVVVWNKAAEKLYDVPQSIIIGKNIEKFFPNALVNVVRKTGVAVENKYHSPRQDSYILANAMPIFIEGQFKGAVSSDRDFAEVKRLYNELDQANSRLSFLEGELKRVTGIFGNLVGRSPALMRKVEMARQIAPTHASVMITGESGTGKEAFARGIHELSGRKGLFVPVNCSAIPTELFESEFFGYCPGAFTGANRKGKAGYFELSNEGTIFLDEIGELPLHLQAKLLRVLQEREVTRLGGDKAAKLDLRIICATNRNLLDMVDQQLFREDLYYRLHVVGIDLPPLRDRIEDIPALIDHFIEHFSKTNNKPIKQIQKKALNTLLGYHWPGNIRELQNVAEQLVVTSVDGIVRCEDIPDRVLSRSICSSNKEASNYPLDLVIAIENLERENIKRALDICGKNKTKAARLLNIPRGTLYHKMEAYGFVKDN